MVAKPVDVLDLCGVFKPKVGGVSVEAMNESIRKHVSRRVIASLRQAQSHRPDRRS